MKPGLSVFAWLVVLTFTSCNLFPDELPPATMTGENTFGCYVDGELFLPKAPLGYGTGVRAELQSSIDTVGINIYASNVNTKQTLLISLFDTPDLVENKAYDLSNRYFTIHYVDYSNPISCHYNSVVSGTIKLSKFIVSGSSKVVAGTFEFVLESADCGNSVIFTNGRFDIGDVN